MDQEFVREPSISAHMVISNPLWQYLDDCFLRPLQVTPKYEPAIQFQDSAERGKGASF